MKKILALSMLLLVAMSLLYAQAPGRTVYQKVIFDPTSSQNILNYVTNTGNTHSPHYILRALHIETGEERGTETYAATVMKIAKLGTAPNQYVAAFFNQSIWPTPWPEGSHLKIRIWCTDATTNPSGVEPYPQYEYAEKTFVVPSGGGAIQMTAAGQEMIVPPFPVIQTDTWTYNLTIQTSDGGAYEFTDPDGVVHTTPITLTDAEGEENSLLGTYTVTSAAPAGFQWESTTIEVVAADFTASAKTAYVYNAVKGFVLVPVPDTYTYTLNIHGPEGGYTVTGPTAALSGTIPYIKTANVVADLLGDYTVAAAPAGYQWVMNPITVSADMFSLVAKKNGGMNKVVLGSRTNGAKANYEYAATITFVLEEIPVQYYTVDITSDPAGAAIYVVGV